MDVVEQSQYSGMAHSLSSWVNAGGSPADWRNSIDAGAFGYLADQIYEEFLSGYMPPGVAEEGAAGGFLATTSSSFPTTESAFVWVGVGLLALFLIMRDKK